MLIEASWTAAHDIRTYAFRQISENFPGPNHIVLTEHELSLWLAVRSYCSIPAKDENLLKPRVLLSMNDIAEPTSSDFTLYLHEEGDEIHLCAVTADGRQHEMVYSPVQASLEASMLLGVARPTAAGSDVLTREWVKVLSYDAKSTK